MLVLSRKLSEQIQIGESITINVSVMGTTAKTETASNPCNPCNPCGKNPCNPCGK